MSDLAYQILESIRRLEEKKPTEWNPAVVLKVKKFLFPKIKEYVEGKTVKEDQVEIAKKEFGI